MQHVDTLIIGGGPAGSTCARQLVRAGREVLVLDRAAFPRTKLCAGWITAKAMADLEFTPADYPHPILKVEARSHVRGLPFALKGMPTAGDDWSIRRYEFDAWLLARSSASVVRHDVRKIARNGDVFVVDDAFTCRHLVGAGGTACPVARAFFPANRRKFRQIVTLELEFPYPARAERSHMYFLHYGAKGYAWYVPKGDGYVNIGIGGKANYIKKSGINIHQRLGQFLQDLVAQGLIDRATADGFSASGHPYYLNYPVGAVKDGRCYLLGDAAGLATMDFGEGIGPAVESGLLAAAEILGRDEYTREKISQYSSVGLTQRLMRRLVAPRPPAA